MRIGAGRNWSTLIVDRDAICDATDGAGVFICLSPYARPGGMVSRALPPTFIICSPSCHPGITELSLNSVGSPRENDESKTVPSLSVPV